jgi:hypothetical protein
MYFVGMHIQNIGAPIEVKQQTGSSSPSQLPADTSLPPHPHPHGHPRANEVVLVTAHFPAAVTETTSTLKAHGLKGSFCGYFYPWHFDSNPANQISRDNVANGIKSALSDGHDVCLHIRGDLGLKMKQLRDLSSVSNEDVQAPVIQDIQALEKITGSKPKFALISRRRPDRMDIARKVCNALNLPYVIPDFTIPMGPQPNEIVDAMMSALAQSHSGRIVVEISEQALYTEVEMFKIPDIIKLAVSRGVKFVQLSESDIQNLRSRQHIIH